MDPNPQLARDEVANMVWAIERTIPSVTGAGRPGKDEARETLQYQQQLVAAGVPPDVPYSVAIAYLAMTSVPEHWIPFMPVHVPGSIGETQRQRSRMLRIMNVIQTHQSKSRRALPCCEKAWTRIRKCPTLCRKRRFHALAYE